MARLALGTRLLRRLAELRSLNGLLNELPRAERGDDIIDIAVGVDGADLSLLLPQGSANSMLSHSATW